MRIVGIIPARYQSSRLPGKPLKDIHGTSMIMRVYNQALKADLADVIVATDDRRILEHVSEYGGKAVMTSEHHQSGTDRCLEAALQCLPHPSAVINIQGDEPFIEPEVIDKLAHLLSREEIEICTLVKPFEDSSDIENPNRVKVLTDSHGRALSFSRKIQGNTSELYQHIGIYGYTLDALKTITTLEPSPLELKEKLEQLRWHENGHSIYCAQVSGNSLCVDTPEDLALARDFAKSMESI